MLLYWAFLYLSKYPNVLIWSTSSMKCPLWIKLPCLSSPLHLTRLGIHLVCSKNLNPTIVFSSVPPAYNSSASKLCMTAQWGHTTPPPHPSTRHPIPSSMGAVSTVQSQLAGQAVSEPGMDEAQLAVYYCLSHTRSCIDTHTSVTYLQCHPCAELYARLEAPCTHTRGTSPINLDSSEKLVFYSQCVLLHLTGSIGFSCLLCLCFLLKGIENHLFWGFFGLFPEVTGFSSHTSQELSFPFSRVSKVHLETLSQSMRRVQKKVPLFDLSC